MQTLRAACLVGILALASTLGAQPLAAQTADSPVTQVPNRVRVSGGVMAGQRLTSVAPTYPDEARASGIEGSVVLHVIVGRDGSVESAEPVSGPPALREAALDAVKQWTYKPFLLNGDPVEVDTTVTVNFNLTHTAPPQL